MLDILRHLLSNDHGEWALLASAFSDWPTLSVYVSTVLLRRRTT